VWAIDVGHGQIDWKLRSDARVVIQEGVNARYLDRTGFPGEVRPRGIRRQLHLAYASDPALIPLLARQGKMILLVKPQFEVERGQVGKGGIVREPALHQAACDRVRAAVEAQGLRADIIESPILGAEGNREFLLYASRESHP
jgi:23S rRNA (cytidine1920-2'-O)/16S rRNA (cytidine1409-2'-O)-methyltransferase